jgi:phospholipid-translocating P-type ATPase (flippase)
MVKENDQGTVVELKDTSDRSKQKLKKFQTYIPTKKRKVYFGNEPTKLYNYNSYFKNNAISTTKYNILTWLPKSILLQFLRAANIYFLIISILTLFPFSPKRASSQCGTFAMVIAFTCLKEGFEDLKRFNADKEINEKETSIYDYNTGKFEKTKWWKVKCGNIIKLENYEAVPCDFIMLKSSLPSGMCFLDTMNLDGETNLKEKMTFTETKDLSDEDLFNIKGKIICDEANEFLEGWDGNFEAESGPVDRFLGNIKNLILKGCTIRNTDYVMGVCIYTGHSTKIMKNAKPASLKVSNLMKIMNYLLYSLLSFLLLICILFSGIFIYWQTKYGEEHVYIHKYGEGEIVLTYDPVTGLDWFMKFLTFVIAYSHIIPISLYVGLEVLKLFQSVLIANDAKMYDPETGNNALARTSDLIEELGQVEFIFSDKTGTLTKNEMIFRKCSINNVVYGNPTKDYNQTTEGENSKYLLNGDPSCFKVLANLNNKEYLNVYDFFTICTVCHEAYVEEIKGKQVVQSSSPDEVALILGAKQVGFDFVKKTPGVLETRIQHLDETIFWDLHLLLKFDSTRKRMSVIVNKKNTEEYWLYTKGADTQMLSSMTLDRNDLSKINKDLGIFSREALRTLVFAKKRLSKEQVEDYKNRFTQISSSSSPDRDQELCDLFQEIESGFNYVGSSAIEDKLQDNVGDTIEKIIQAKIRFWVLTGDKKETALEIGKSCKMVLPDSMEPIDLANTEDIPDTKKQVIEKLDKWFHHYYEDNEMEEIIAQRPFTKKYQRKDVMSKNPQMYMIIDGLNLTHILHDDILSRKFFRVGLIAKSVLCCRVSPAQKAQVVSLASTNGTWITLSIGDGANDVPMILTANIGIGISGKEGTQAVRSADYALGQFQFLKKILFTHGRWGYRRVSYFIYYYFYKNILLVLVEMYFAIFSGFSGMIFFPDFLPLLYNAAWTSWPCMFAFSVERDVDEETSDNCPILYEAGQLKYYFNIKIFWLWIIFAIIHGGMIYFVGLESIENFLSDDGMIGDHWLKTTILFSLIVHVVTYKIYIELKYWNLFNL